MLLRFGLKYAGILRAIRDLRPPGKQEEGKGSHSQHDFVPFLIFLRLTGGSEPSILWRSAIIKTESPELAHFFAPEVRPSAGRTLYLVTPVGEDQR